MNDIAYRLDNLICDRIETLVDHAKRLEKSDPELAEWVLSEALDFASSLDDSAEDAIFWCMPLGRAQP
jgi:hypothetical protein